MKTRKRKPTGEIRTRKDLPKGVPFSLSCRCCDIDPPGETLESAILGGWTEIYLDDGHGWNFIGLCVECRTAGN